MAHSVAKHALLSALASVATLAASAGGMIIVARTLGVEQTGIISLALWLVTTAMTVAGLGLPMTATRYIAEAGAPQDRRALAMHFLRPSLLAAGALLLVFGGAALALWLGLVEAIWRALAVPDRAAHSEIWLILGVMAAAQVLGQYRLGVLRGEQDFRGAAMLSLSGLVLQLTGILIGSLAFGTVGALAGYALGALPAALSCLRMRGRGEIDRPVAARARRFALYSWAGTLMSAFVWARVEIVFLQQFGHVGDVGLFTAGLTLANLAMQGPLLLTGALLPHFADAHAAGATARIRESYATASRLTAFLAFPAGLGLAAIVPLVLPMVFGDAFRPAVPAASLLVAVSAIGVVAAVGTHLVNALERSDFIFYSSLGGAILALAAGFLLVPPFGLMGAAAARALIQLAMITAGLCFITRSLRCRAPLNDLAKLFLAAGLAALAARACLIAIPGPVSLLAALPLAGVVYLAGVRLSGALTAEDRIHLRHALTLLPGGIGAVGRPVLRLIGG